MTGWRHSDLEAMERAYGLQRIADVCHLCERIPLPESRVICDACLASPAADIPGGTR